MMAEENLAPRIARLERQFADLKRLLTLGALGGGDAEATLRQHTALLGKLIGDDTLGNVLMGPFPGSAPPQVFRLDDGSFYLGGTLGTWPTADTFGLSVNRLYALPFYMPAMPNFMDEIAIEVSTINVGGAGNARLGVYDDNGSLYPGKLIKDAGTVITGLLGPHITTVNESTPRGLKWLVLVVDIAVELRLTGLLQSAGSWAMLGTGPGGPGPPRIGYRAAFTYAPLPILYPSGATKVGSIPLVYISFKPGGWS
ncbi:hypothetical protein LCGC14_1926060 [marine sediment metagenome]|uniref:Uncharacterized protein n=1 Tax=marine sediment metagenome TaxID=412755 RepID=A0A0F9GCT9_9ZZZZ